MPDMLDVLGMLGMLEMPHATRAPVARHPPVNQPSPPDEQPRS
jgi:hypothetical protein